MRKVSFCQVTQVLDWLLPVTITPSYFFLPSRLSGFKRNLPTALWRDIGHPSIAADFSALLAHLRHDAGDKRAADLLSLRLLCSQFDVTDGNLIYVFRHLPSRAL
jgi:hypothetical protein